MKKYFKRYKRLHSVFIIIMMLGITNANAQSGEGYYGPTTNSGTASHGVGTADNAFFIASTGSYDGVSFGPSTDFFGGPAFVAGTQEIAGSVAPSFSTLQISNGATSILNITNTAGIDVAVALQLNNGITTTVNNVAGAIRLTAAATNTGTFSTTSFVDGYVGKAGANSFLFPLGSGSTYSPTTFSNPNGTTLRYTLGAPGMPTALSTTQGAINLATVSNKEFYPISSLAPSASSITIPYGNFGPAGYVTDPSTLTIAGFNGTSWVNLGSASNIINTTAKTVTIALNQALTSSFTQITLGSTSAFNPLPVTLTSFNATAANCTASLKFKTSAEYNSKSYGIEHSTDGVNFTSIAIVPSNNNATGASYTYTDKNIAAGINYYRLKMIDIDEAFTYSNVISISSNCNGAGTLTVWPNPAKDVIKVAGLTGKNTLIILDAQGKRMASIFNANPTQNINVSQFAGGTYFIQVNNTNGKTTTIKFVKN